MKYIRWFLHHVITPILMAAFLIGLLIVGIGVYQLIIGNDAESALAIGGITILFVIVLVAPILITQPRHHNQTRLEYLGKSLSKVFDDLVSSV